MIRKNSLYDWLLITISITIIFVIVLMVSLGIAWIILPAEELAFWLILLVTTVVSMAASVLAYSIVSYRIEHTFRSVLLIFMAVNVMVISFLFLVTNMAFVNWSPFADRERNRSIVAIFGFVLAPSVLFGSLSLDKPFEGFRKYWVLIWNVIVVPFIAIWFFLSPVPVFITAETGLGLAGISPIGWVIISFVIGSGIIALLRFGKAWHIGRNHLDLSLFLTQLHWIFSLMLFMVQSNPLMVMELFWFGNLVAGFFLIAIGIIITTIIQPFGRLEGVVQARTRELEKSKQEVEFYLNVWSHKIGNLLQGIISYLELVGEDVKETKSGSRFLNPAFELSKEATLINRQVSVLTQVKSDTQKMASVDITKVINDAISTSGSILGRSSFVADTSALTSEVYVSADDYLELVFVNLISFSVAADKVVEYVFRIEENEPEDLVSVIIQCEGFPEIPDEVKSSFLEELDPSKTTLGLDLFTIKILMDKYDGQIEYNTEPGSASSFIFRFRRTTIAHDGSEFSGIDQKPIEKHDEE